jgi:type III secretion protein U
VSGEKTYDPTPKRLKQAREDGQIANSHDVVAVVKLSVIFGLIFATDTQWVAQLSELVSSPFELLNLPFLQAVMQLAHVVAGAVARLVIVALFVSIVGTLAGTWLQTGIVISFKKLAPKPDLLNPASGVKKFFNLAQLGSALLNLVKILILVLVIVLTLREVASTMLSLGTGDSRLALSTALALLRKVVLFTVLSFAVIAAIDYAIKKRKTTNDLKMSLEDVRRDMKDAMGDPHFKAHRQRLARELANEPLPLVLVPKATVVVTNPTHFAVAILYEEQETPLPIVLTKGADDTAKEMIAVAEAAGVPVIRYVWLARTLFASAQPGDFIPTATIQAVAAVLRAIKKVSREDVGPAEQE